MKEIAGELGVAHILEGSVRKSGDNVRITVHLIDAINDKHLWAESYDRDIKDLFAIQSDVAQQIAKALKAEITPEVKERIEYIPTKSLEAYNLYLQAYFQIDLQTTDGREKAIELLERAIDIDPNFSNAYVSLAVMKMWGVAWARLGGGMDTGETVKIAKPYILKAIEIDENNYFAHSRLVWYYLYFEWDFMNAGKEYNKAKELRPSYTDTDFLITSGRFEEACEEAKKAVEFDPLSSNNWSSMILSSYFANRHEESLKTIEEIEKTGLSDSYTNMESSRVYLYLGKYEDVINTIDKLTSQYGELKASSWILGLLSIANYYTGQREKAKEFLRELQEQSKINAGGSSSFYVAMVYAQMGEPDLAFEWLKKAYKTHEIEMYWLKVEPPFNPLHDDPRWQVMLDKVGFPED